MILRGPSLVAWLSALGALCAAPGELRAQPLAGGTEWAELMSYTVRPGDTCASIAQRLYRDARRVDLIHAVNRLGPLPHRLVPGTVLRLPRRATSARGAIPDAVLSGLGGEVFVLSPASRPGRRNDPLFRGNQVSTHARASAEITFLDESQIHVQENTLVVILGDTSGRVRRTATAMDTTLVSGGLRAYLGALAGRPNATTGLSIQTPGGRVTVGEGEAAVRVDSSRRTTLAVYRGSSRIRTRRQSLTVPQGFSVAAPENAATRLSVRALPAAPVWQSAPPGVVFTEGHTELRLSWRAGATEVPTGFHVQVARDPSFMELATDSRLAANVTELVAPDVPTGTWRMRVSAVDSEGVESAYSQEALTRVVQPRIVPTPRAHRSVIELPNGLFCGLDDQALTEVTVALPVERTRPHTLRCAAAPEGSEAAELTVGAERLGPLTVTASMLGANARERMGRVRLRFLDNSAEPMVNREIVATASAGVSVGGFTEYEEPGVYVLPVRWTPGTESFSLHLAVGEDSHDTQVFDLPASPRPPSPPPRLPGLAERLSLSIEAGGGTMLSVYQQNRDAQAYEGNTRGFGLGLSTGAVLGVDLGEAVALTAGARLWLFPSDLVPLGAANTYSLGVQFSPRLSARARLVFQAEAGAALTGELVRFTFGLGAGLDLRLSRALSLGPMLRYGHVVQPDTNSADVDEDARFWSLGLRLGLRLPR